ncbi:hypothetical protein Q5P01_016165 [Channa striata]|uniref:Uncharacterized protein n=1 Tax=Channa striata TaxID=64152 RepID=A0AA88MHB5_CHASR|nr:hypothetical protein Q5P01_016165 [Channa striata]
MLVNKTRCQNSKRLSDMDKNTVTRTFSIGAICSGTKDSDDFFTLRRNSSAGIRTLLWATSSAVSFRCSPGSVSPDHPSRETICPNILTPDSIPQFTIPSLSVENSLRITGSLDKEKEEDDGESEEDLRSSGTEPGLFVTVSPACSTLSSSTSSSGRTLLLSDRKAERSVSDPLTRRRSLLQKEGSYSRSCTEAQQCLDPASRAALSLPHLTKVTTPYGFITLSQSPHMVSEEALLCQAGLQRLIRDEEAACFLSKSPGTRTGNIKGSSSYLSGAKKRLSKDSTDQ